MDRKSLVGAALLSVPLAITMGLSAPAHAEPIEIDKCPPGGAAPCLPIPDTCAVVACMME